MTALEVSRPARTLKAEAREGTTEFPSDARRANPCKPMTPLTNLQSVNSKPSKRFGPAAVPRTSTASVKRFPLIRTMPSLSGALYSPRARCDYRLTTISEARCSQPLVLVAQPGQRANLSTVRASKTLRAPGTRNQQAGPQADYASRRETPPRQLVSWRTHRRSRQTSACSNMRDRTRTQYRAHYQSSRDTTVSV